jgi:hypothetical protein
VKADATAKTEGAHGRLVQQIIGFRREGALVSALGRVSRSSLDRAAFPHFEKPTGARAATPDARIEEGNHR